MDLTELQLNSLQTYGKTVAFTPGIEKVERFILVLRFSETLSAGLFDSLVSMKCGLLILVIQITSNMNLHKYSLLGDSLAVFFFL